ncbi:MAG: extracellular solute-binding protein, partial [Spirochaetales bacterium]|nr:extracellular solute-binding protein [Spirochaetales bacterium]
MKRVSFRCLIVALVLLLGAALTVTAGGKQEAAGGKAAATEITVWCMAFDPHVNGMTNVIEAFNEKNPAVKVVLEPQPGQAEMTSKMRAALSAGRGAQAFTTTGTTLTEWAVPGNIQPVSPDVVTIEQVKKDFLPEYYIQCNLNNQIWAIGIPDPPGDCGVIVNAKHLREAGLAVKQKFDSRDELLSYGKKLAKYEGGKLVRGGLSFQESNDPNFIYSYIVEIGGRFWDNDA